MGPEEWKKLQNGSDIRGIALEGIPGEQVNLSPEVAGILGRSFARWLLDTKPGSSTIAVGTDSRLSGPSLKAAFIDGLLASGMNVLDCGMASTPAMFMCTIDPELNADAGVMLTASHLPFNRNGLKFFTSRGGLDKNDISRILELAGELSVDGREKAGKKGSLESVDFLSAYAGNLVQFIREAADDPRDWNNPLKGLKIIVDAGNGAGGFFAGKVLEPLGADISGSQFLDPDGKFPNHVPNPEDADAMESISNAVKREKADLGIIFDTDVDRSAIVDSDGSPVNRNDLIALISAVVLEEHPGSVIVTDSITSTGLKNFIEENLGGTHHRFKRGYKNVINESIRLNGEGKDSWLAIETSGHAALKENHFLDDGAYLVAKLLARMAIMNREGKRLTSLIRELKGPVESEEYRLSILEEDFFSYGKTVLSGIAAAISEQEGWEPEIPNFEGLRVNCTDAQEDGWFLLRMSLHDPVMPLNIESNVRDGVGSIAARLKVLLKDYHRLDVTSMD